MWSVKDMFYGEAEPVWILKPEKDNNKGSESKGEGGSGGGGNRKQAERVEEYSILSSIPYYPYYYPDYNPPQQPKRQESSSRTGGFSTERQQSGQQGGQQGGYQGGQQGQQGGYQRGQQGQQGGHQGGYQGGQQQQGGQQKKETKIVMKIPICCGECAESIEAALYGMKGVKSVDCDSRREKVTVVATTAAPADILMECRRVFRKSRFWTDDD